MKNSMKKVIAKMGAKLLQKAAYSTHDSACMLATYQSKEPECMKQK